MKKITKKQDKAIKALHKALEDVYMNGLIVTVALRDIIIIPVEYSHETDISKAMLVSGKPLEITNENTPYSRVLNCVVTDCGSDDRAWLGKFEKGKTSFGFLDRIRKMLGLPIFSDSIL